MACNVHTLAGMMRGAARWRSGCILSLLPLASGGSSVVLDASDGLASIKDTFAAAIECHRRSTTAVGFLAPESEACETSASDFVRSLADVLEHDASRTADAEWQSFVEEFSSLLEREGLVRTQEGPSRTALSALSAAGDTDEQEEVHRTRTLGAEEDFLQIDNAWANVALTFVCVVCAGLAAGLTMGLVSIEPLEMAIKQRSGTPEEQRQAARILPLVSRHHFLLVTLLLFNSLANEALPIFLGNLVPSWLAVILSVSLVLFFGEILPSAVFTGPGQLAIAAGLAWLVYGLMVILGPIAWPISWMLDRVLGIEGFKRYNRAEIAALVEVQQELSAEDVHDYKMHPDEAAIVNGVLQTAEKIVAEAMIDMDKVFCLSSAEKLTAHTMADIMAAGYSRVLVYEGTDTLDIRGYLQVKKLIILNPDDEREISSLSLRIPVVVAPTKSLLELLNTFQTGRSHLALVSNSPGLTLEALQHGARLEGAARPIGIITLEDIIEEIIQEEIMDESDRLTHFIEKRAKDTLLRFTHKRRERRFFGKLSRMGLGTPRSTGDKSFLKKVANTAAVPGGGPLYDSIEAIENGGGAPSPSVSDASAPGARGGERMSLLARSGSGSNRSVTSGRGGSRASATAEAMILAIGRARDNSERSLGVSGSGRSERHSLNHAESKDEGAA